MMTMTTRRKGGRRRKTREREKRAEEDQRTLILLSSSAPTSSGLAGRHSLLHLLLPLFPGQSAATLSVASDELEIESETSERAVET